MKFALVFVDIYMRGVATPKEKKMTIPSVSLSANSGVIKAGSGYGPVTTPGAKIALTPGLHTILEGFSARWPASLLLRISVDYENGGQFIVAGAFMKLDAKQQKVVDGIASRLNHHIPFIEEYGRLEALNDHPMDILVCFTANRILLSLDVVKGKPMPID